MMVRGNDSENHLVDYVFCTVAAIICGLEILTGLPAQVQVSLPLGTHLWTALWCALGMMIIVFVRLSRGYPLLFVVCSTAICTLDWLVLGLKYSHIAVAGLLSTPNVEIISNVLNLIAIIVLTVSWPRSDSGKDGNRYGEEDPGVV